MGPNTGAHGSCSAMLNGELFVFGVFQISKIIDCELKRIGSLPIYSFSKGACGTFLFDGAERVMLCFHANDKKGCFR